MKKKEYVWTRRVIGWVWGAVLIILIGTPLFIYTVVIDLGDLYGKMPRTQEIENPENDLSSELISADGLSLGRYFRYNRSQITIEDLSEDLVNTLLLSEDHRFYSHSGIDLQAFLRVLWGLTTFNPAGGGSTITQQLAKNLYTRNVNRKLDGKIAQYGKYPKRIVEKIKEWIIAVQLERNFTKEEIIAMYLNTAEFSSNSYGIKVAAETYFSKSTKDLNLEESALLIGMLQNPTLYNPVVHADNAIAKRNEVLYKIYRHRYKIGNIDAYDSIISLPLSLKFEVQNHNKGLATYFRTVIRNYLMAFCQEKGIDLWNAGLKIYTTIDSRIQQHAEEVVHQQMEVLQKDFDEQWKGKNPWVDDEGKEIENFLHSRIKTSPLYKKLAAKYGEKSDSIDIILNKKRHMRVFTWKGVRDTLFSYMDSLSHYKRFLHASLIAIDPTTGHIKAWVGGINHTYFKYDHVKQGHRQPGSTFKPFVYGLAMESGYSPCYEMKDISPSFKVPGGVWFPPNSDGKRGNGEKMTIRQAMARSVNSITAQMIQALGAENVVEFAHRTGISSPLDPVPSLCLGTSDVSLYEMVGAYNTFVNKGVYTKPFYITRIEDKKGNVIKNFIPETRQAISEKTAYKTLYMLKGGIEERGGTSKGLSKEVKIDNEIGGKTGTTDNASDGWYIGLTHNLTTGVWVGGDERIIHFPSWISGQGSRTARPIWEKFMLRLYEDPNTNIEKGFFNYSFTQEDFQLNCDDKNEKDSTNVENIRPWIIHN